MGYYDSYGDYGYDDYGDDQSINFSDYDFKPGPGGYQKDDFSDFPDQPQSAKTDLSDFPDQPKSKPYETYTAPGTTVTPGADPTVRDKIINAWEQLKGVQSSISPIGASARFADEFGSKVGESIRGQGHFGKTLFESEVLHDPMASAELSQGFADPFVKAYSDEEKAKYGDDFFGRAKRGTRLLSRLAMFDPDAIAKDWEEGNVGGLAGDILPPLALGYGMHKLGGLGEIPPEIPAQREFGFMKDPSLNQRVTEPTYTPPPPESPIVQRAKAMAEIDNIAQQRILELKMQQSQATQIGDHATATRIANDILKVEMDVSTQKRNWTPPPPEPAPSFEDLSGATQPDLNFSSYRGPGGKFMGTPSPEMRRGVPGPPIAELPKPIDFSGPPPTVEDMAPPSPAGPAVLPGEGLREFQRRTGLRWAEAKRWWDISQANQPPVAADKTPFRSPNPAGDVPLQRTEEPPLEEPPDVPVGPTSQYPARVEIRAGTGDAALWRSRGYGPVADTNARINGNPVWEPKGNAPEGRTPFERAMRAKTPQRTAIPSGRVRHVPGEDIVVPNENLKQAAPNLEAAGYQIVEGSDTGTTTTFRPKPQFRNPAEIVGDESGTYDPKQLWENLKRMFGRNPTAAEIDSVLSRQAGEGETTGRVANFPSPTTREHDFGPQLGDPLPDFPRDAQGNRIWSKPPTTPDEIRAAYQKNEDILGKKGNDDYYDTMPGPEDPRWSDQIGPRQIKPTDVANIPEQPSLPGTTGPMRVQSQLERISNAKPEPVDLGPQPTQESLMSRFIKDEEGTFDPREMARNVGERLRGVADRLRGPRSPLERARELFAGAAREITGGDMASRIDRQLGPENSTLQQILENDTPQRLRDGIEFWTDYARQNAESGNEFAAALSNRYVDIAQARLAELEHGHVAATRNLPSQEELPPAGPQSRSVTLRPDDATVEEVDNATTPGHLQDIIDAHNRASYEAAAEPNSSYMADWHAAIRDRAITRLEELRSQQTGEQTRVTIPSQTYTPAQPGGPVIEVFNTRSGEVLARLSSESEARRFISEHPDERHLDYSPGQPTGVPSTTPDPVFSDSSIYSPAEQSVHRSAIERIGEARTIGQLNKVIRELAQNYPHMVDSLIGRDILETANRRNTELGGTTPIEIPRPQALDISTVPGKTRIAKRATPLTPEPYNPYKDPSITGQIRERQAVQYGDPRQEYQIRDYGRTEPIQAEEGPLPREPLLPFDEELNPRAMSEDMTSPESASKQGKGKIFRKPGITTKQYENLIGSVDRSSLSQTIDPHSYIWGDDFGRSTVRSAGDGPPGLRVVRDANTPGKGRIVFRNKDGRPLASARFTENGITALGADPDMGQAGKLAVMHVLEHAADIGVLKADSSISPFTANLMRQAKRLINDDTGAIPLDAYFNALREVRDRATGAWKWLMESPGKYKGERLPSRFEKAIGLPTALTTTLDFSMPFRQGFGKIFTPEWRAAWKPMFQAAWDPKLAAKIDAQIRDLPAFQETRDPVTQKIYKSFGAENGIKLIEPGELYRSEVDVAGNYAEQIPGLKRPIKASNRAAATFLNHMRANMFQNLVDAGEAMSAKALTNERAPYPGIMGGFDLPKSLGGRRIGFTKEYTPEQAENLNLYNNPKLAKAAARYVNSSTGRGPMGALEPAARVLGHVMFSPRGLASRVDMLNPFTYLMANPFVRKQYIKSAIGGAAAWYGMAQLAKGAGKLAGVDVEVNDDWDSADAGKFRIGNFRMDPAAGFQQLLVLYHRILVAGGWTSSATGKKNTFGKGYRAETVGSTGQRFFANKLAPIAKFAYDMGFATENVPVHMADRTMQMFVPLFAQDLWELAHEEPRLIPIAGPLAGLGMGSQIYDKGESISKFIPPKYDYLYKGDPKTLMPWNRRFLKRR